MFDLHSKMVTFHDSHVRLGQAKKQDLADLRKINLDRLNEGLDKLSEEDGVEYAHPVENCDQGGYAMDTLVQYSQNEYDIDVAIIFLKEDLPDNPLKARQRIAAAFKKVEANFKKPPEARANAVTVWYADGYHVDFAVYRRFEDAFGVVTIEHAGPEWASRDPKEITDWFNDTVKKLSPEEGLYTKVRAKQMRRVVRLLKAFAKPRSDWNLPSGMVLSTLVAEGYRANGQRDDVALYDTMSAIHTRLLGSTRVYNPVRPELELTAKRKHAQQVENLRDELGNAMDELAVLQRADCTRKQAMDAWYWVFQHPYWQEDETKSGDSSGRAAHSVVSGSEHKIGESQPFA